MMIYIFMSVLTRLIWATWSLHVFLTPYFVHILVEVLHSLIGWKNTWMIILMYITYNLEHILIHICNNISCYFLMTHIYMDAPMICNWVTWRLIVSLAQHLVHLMLEELHPTSGWIYLWLENIFVANHLLCYIFLIFSLMAVWVRLLWVIWSLLVFFAHYLV